MHLSIIAAVAENGVIGRQGQMPWHLSADLQRFKRLTMGHTIIMGRRTFESIGCALPGRRMVLLTRQSDYQTEDAQIVASLDEALKIADHAADEEAFVIGGAEVYREALPRADRLYLTRVHANVDGDTLFPATELTNWTLLKSETHEADSRNDHPFSFEIYERTNS